MRLTSQETGDRALRSVRCFHRIANQALPFESIEMLAGEGYYGTVIPGDAIDPQWDLMLFFEFEFDDGTATRWPEWQNGTPYLVIPTV